MIDEEMAEIAAPIMFLHHRLRLVTMWRAAQELSVSNEVRSQLDKMLADTEEATQTLLLRTPLPDDDFIDEVFDDEFLSLCLDMRVDLLSWLNQPEMLLRLEHPDAILLRYANIAAASGYEADAINSSASFAQEVFEMENKINATFEAMKRNNVL